MAGLTKQNDVTPGKSFPYANPSMVLAAIESIDSVIQIKSDVNVVLDQVMDAVLDIFNSSRAWLFHPCNPELPYFNVNFESTTPEYPGANTIKQKVPMTDDMADYCRRALSAVDGPEIDPPEGRPVTNDIAIRFNVKSMLFMALRPKSGEPWMFGLHQCDRDRIWTDDEKQLFNMIGKRISVCLDNLLYVRQLRESEQRFRSYVENANDIIYTLTPDGCFNYVSPNWIDFFGETAEKAMGKSFENYVHPEDIHICREFLDKVINTGEKQSNIQYRVRQRDGSFHWHVSNGSPLRNSEGDITTYLGIARNIGEYKQMEQALKESEERFRAIFENINDAVLIHKILPNGEPGNFLLFNNAAKNMSGYASEELKSMSPRELDDPIKAATYIPMAMKQLIENGYSKFEAVQIAKNGGEVDIEVNAVATILDNNNVILSVCRDISERKHYEDSLKKYKNIVSSTTDGIAYLDKNYRYIIVNDAYENFSGVNRSDFLGVTVAEYLGADVFEQQVKPNFDRCLEGNVINYQEWFDYPTLGRRYMDVSYYPYKNDRGQIVGIIANTRDITARKIAERKISQNAENLKTIFDSTPNMLSLVDKDVRIEMINRKGAALVGKSKENLSGLLCGDVFLCQHSFQGEGCGTNPECSDCPLRTRVLSTFATGEPHIEEEGRMTFLVNDKKTVMDFLISTSLLDIGGNKKVFLSLTDVSERKDAIRALRESEEKFRLAFHTSPDSINLNRLVDGKYLEINQGFTQIMGYGRDDVIGKTSLELDIWKNPDDRRRLVEGLKEKGHVENLEAQFVAKNGSIKYGLMSARMLTVNNSDMIISITRDITERKNYEVEISRQKRLFETMFNTIPDGVVLTNKKREIQLANKGMEITFGYKPVDIIGKKTSVLYAARDKFEETGKIVFGEDAEKSGDLYITRYRDKHGREFSGETFGARLYDENKQWIGNLSIMRDITEREQAELRIQQAQKMESIGNLAGGIAHDFNNILFPIVGMSELLLEDLPPNSSVYENAQEILKAGKRGSDLVKQILSFSRQSEHKLMPIRVQQILKEVIKLARATIPAFIEIRQSIQPDCGLIMADPTQIHQVAMNIITNAYHAIQDTGGKISIKLNQMMLEEEESTNINLGPGNYAILSVSDTGHGMPKELVEKIFDPYFTTKEQGKGTGLGLAVVYGIIKEHKGGIKVHSEIGKGSAFDIYLPLIEKTRDAEPIPSVEDCQGGDEHILLVDDEQSIARLEKQMLERMGYKVTFRLHSVEALEAFRAGPHSFDLVVTDMSMPNMPGDELAGKIKIIRPDVPIIICTGFSERIREDNIKKMGIDGMLMKPVVKSELAKVVRKVLDEAKRDNQG